MTIRKGIGSYPEDETQGETGRNAGKGSPARNKPITRAGKKQPDPARIQKTLNRYRKEMAEDAPATNSPEDNP